jgi:hypothetical protein
MAAEEPQQPRLPVQVDNGYAAELGRRALAPLPMLGARHAWKAAEDDQRDHHHRLHGGQPAAAVQCSGFLPCVEHMELEGAGGKSDIRSRLQVKAALSAKALKWTVC